MIKMYQYRYGYRVYFKINVVNLTILNNSYQLNFLHKISFKYK